MPVLHGGMAHISELRLPPGRLAVKTTVGIAGARMCVVLALLSMKADTAMIVAPAVLPQDRDKYMRRVADLLRDVEIGDGAVSRAAREAQREVFRAPSVLGGVPRWSR